MGTMDVISTGLIATAAPLVQVAGARGVNFVLTDGREVLDASNTAAPLGHGHPAVAEAIRAAAGSPSVNEGWAWEGRDRAAEALMDSAFQNEDWVGGVRFCLSGSEANDLALSLAQAITGRSALVTRERAYHGMTGLAREMTRQPHWHGGLSLREGGVKAPPRLADVREISAPGCGLRDQGSRCVHQGSCACVPDAEQKLTDAAAVILDYTQGGFYPSSLYQDRVARAAKEAGVLWIADEVVTGLGRTGVWMNYMRGETRPDIVTLGKPLTGGNTAGGAVVISAELREQLRSASWQTYSTFRGNPISVAAIEATVRTIDREGLCERVAVNESILANGLRELAERHPSIRRVDGCGYHWTVEFHGRDWREWYADEAGAPLASRIAEQTLAKDVLIATSGEETSLFLAPPLIAEPEHLERIVAALDHGIEATERARSVQTVP